MPTGFWSEQMNEYMPTCGKSVATRVSLISLLSAMACNLGSTQFLNEPRKNVAGTTSNPAAGANGGSGGNSDTFAGGGDSLAAAGTTTDPSPDACDTTAMPAEATSPGYTAARDPEVASLLSSMSLDEKIRQLYGMPYNSPTPDYNDIERSQDVSLANGKLLRGFKYRDGARGVNLEAGQSDRPSHGKDFSTAFPAPSIRAASWDVELEMRVGEAIGDETMASQNNLLLAPCVNIVRHPYWGRTQEAYGEDMHHVGRMASAFAAGAQQHVLTCATHFAANNIENNRANQNAIMDEQTLRESYGRHFGMVVREGGVGCVMAAYNSVNGKKSTQNRHLLTDILRGPIEKGGMGFRGLVLSDWWAMPGDQSMPDVATAQSQAATALKAGLDVELPWGLNFPQLGALVGSAIAQEDIDAAAGRVLEQKFRFNSVYTDSPWGLGTAKTRLSGDSITNDEGNLALAEETEVKSAVLLSNGSGNISVLPIKNATSIAVVGLDVDVRVSGMTTPPKTGNKLSFATDVNIGDRGSGRVNADPAKCIGPYAGIKAAAAGHGITNVTTGTDVATAQGADFIVAVVGLTAGDEGEEYSLDSLGDRRTLSIGPIQENFVYDLLSLNKPTAIIVESGSIVNLPWLSHRNKNQATIWAGYGGQRAGAAFGKLLLGEANFSGKMPLAWPKEMDLPPFRTDSNGRSTTMGYFFGYRYYDDLAAHDNRVDLIFPFGHGLSYTMFQYSNLRIPCWSVSKTGVVNITVDIANTGSVDGDEVAMLFVAGPPKPSDIGGNRPVKELKRFQRVSLKATGESTVARVTLPLNIQDLRHWEGDTNGSWVIDAGEYTIMVGPSADDADLQLKGTITVHN
jgi:beta-glucosidase